MCIVVSAMMPATSSSDSGLKAAISAMADADAASTREKKEREKEEAEKTADEETNQTLEQQETMKISGSNARHMVMQKLMRQSQVIFGDDH